MIRSLAMLCLAMGLVSCVPPKAAVVADSPTVKKVEPVQEPVIPEPDMPPAPDPEIRVPPMLNLPTDGEFRASNPILPKTSGSGVIVRPPTDPPSRVKPTE